MPAGYKIDHINISAFASIEGPEDWNKELYRNRGEVIYNEIARLLSTPSNYTLRVDENWGDFYADISRSPRANLRNLSPEEIRAKLKDRKFSEELEPILKHHRKATVIIHLSREVDPGIENLTELVNFYVENLESANLENAIKLQDAIEYQARDQRITPRFPHDLPMPQAREFSWIFNRDYVIRQKHGWENDTILLNLFIELAKSYPENPAIRFNIAELLLRQWLTTLTDIKPDSIFRTINRLSEQGVAEKAANRLLLNYHLNTLPQTMTEKNSRQRIRSLQAIRSLYPATTLKDEELVNLARLFVAYRQNNMAERLLRPFARLPHPDQELLFFYISLSINDENIANQRWYANLLNKAYSINPQRFCNLFQPVSIPDAAGISLLFRDNIKEIYCRNCGEQLGKNND